MKKKNLLLGVCGGIACYKALDIIRHLQDKNFAVKVILTKAAQEFITPLTFQTISKQSVSSALFDATEENNISHIQLAQNYPIFLIAPATANIIGKMANAIADDLLSTVFLASTAKVIIAPAMNNVMWENKILQENISRLIKNGVLVIPPESGYLACETIGAGRLAAIEKIVAAVSKKNTSPLSGLKALITLGATTQPIDPFRFVSNPASGKMGYELALALSALNVKTTVIAGFTRDLPPIIADKVIKAETTLEMAQAFRKEAANQDIIIKTAAISDYQTSYSDTKIKKQNFSLQFKKTIDIIGSFAASKAPNVTLVGFSAETDNLLKNSRQKLTNKQLDMVVANQISAENTSFGSDYNKITMIGKDFEISLPKATKKELAYRIIEKIVDIRGTYNR